MTDQETNFLDLARDPHQYDSPELNWSSEGLIDSPVRMYLWDRIKPLIGYLDGVSVLDVGTGSAWMPLRMHGELDADNITALEPSAAQRELARQINPDQPIEPEHLLEFETDKVFDLITAIMVFEHIYPLEPAFQHLAEMSKFGTALLTVFGDKQVFLTPRTDYEVSQELVDEDTVAIKAVRDYGTLGDIVRSPQTIIEAAETAGFVLTHHQPLVPDEDLRKKVSRYSSWEDQPICHLMMFTYAQS